MPVYDVIVKDRTFRVEVEEISQNRFRVIINGREEIIEMSEKVIEIKKEKKDDSAPAVVEGGEIRAEMSGTVVKVLVRKGDRIEKGQALLVLEAMKMENEIASHISGIVVDIPVADGDKVQAGDVLAVISPDQSESSSGSQNRSSSSQDGSVVKSEMAGTVVRVLKKEGENVRSGEAVLVLEAMKMENEVSSPADGVITRIFVDEGSRVQIGDPLFSLS